MYTKVLSTRLIKYARAHFNSNLPLKCLFMYQLQLAIVTNGISNIYRTTSKFLPNTIIYFTR